MSEHDAKFAGFDNRRVGDIPLGDTSRILAIAYTLGYFGMVAVLVQTDVPKDNHDIVVSLVSIMSAVQLHIMGFYFGSSKNAETSQKAAIQAKDKADTSLRDIAKAVVPTATGDGATVTTTTQTAVKKGKR